MLTCEVVIMMECTDEIDKATTDIAQSVPADNEEENEVIQQTEESTQSDVIVSDISVLEPPGSESMLTEDSGGTKNKEDNVEANSKELIEIPASEKAEETPGSKDISDNVNSDDGVPSQPMEGIEEESQAQIEEDGNATDNSVIGESEVVSQSYPYWNYELSSQSSSKHLIGTRKEEFCNPDKGKRAAKFLKGCKWAPDGSCLLSCSDDDNLRLFNFPTCFSSVQDWTSDDCLPDNANSEEWNSALKIKEGGLIYDYCWYPLMTSMDPVSSCFISTSSEAPIHLWDAFSGKLRASYLPINHLEQLVSARSLAFDPTGESIYSGFEKKIRIFNITRPGRECTERVFKQEHAELNQYGIIASICVNPALRSFYAVGSFDKTIGLYYEDGSVICLLQGHVGGITHMKFSSDGMKLFTGGRNDTRLFEWDMRKMNEKYKIYDRVVTTHQRIYFDLTPNDRYLITGGTDGIVRIYETETEETEPCCIFKANNDCVNGVSCNPFIPLVATSSGQRHFFEIASDSDDDEMFVKSDSSRERSCDIKLWKIT